MTSSITVDATLTVLDHLIEHLRARDVQIDGQERPAAILWTDPKAEWRPVIPTIQTRLDELLILGDLAPDMRTGPAIWIRCLVDRTLDEPALPGDRAPIVYLPGVARQELRAGEECHPELRPLVELLFRGALWLQHNGRDWGVGSFLTSTKTLGLDIARDDRTIEAMLRALPEVVLTPIAQLSGRRLEADDFDRMLSNDLIRDMLQWMVDPDGTKTRLGPGRWGAFCNRCREELAFDPEVDADITAGERLGKGDAAWAKVWARFLESPTLYKGIDGLLRRSRPRTTLLFDRSRWPDLNDEDDQFVRKELTGLTSLPHDRACDAVLKLESAHGPRRKSVWARLGQTPMADVLEPLSRLADVARTALGGNTPDDVATAYLTQGWIADAATWEALRTAGSSDEELIKNAVRHLLGPWLDDSCRAFQGAVERVGLPGSTSQIPVEASEDTCILFVDGLRYDLGCRLGEMLEGRGCRVNVGHRWSGIPTVTATAKPAVTPVAPAVVGEFLGEDFAPKIRKIDKPATAVNLRTEMQSRGYQVLTSNAIDWPKDEPARGWGETGDIDTLGHQRGSRIARQIPEELDRLTDRITALLDAGWQNIRVVTDHGWLLLPGGLPKVDLPKHLTETRWSRAAVIAGESAPDVMRVPWYWNSAQSFATPPGSACFNKSDEYAHGGLSIQECLIPDILVERVGGVAVSASIQSITWRGLRCYVETQTSRSGVTADLCLHRPSGKSVTAAAKAIGTDGSVSLVLSDDQYESEQLVLVLLDDSGKVLGQLPTRVGLDT